MLNPLAFLLSVSLWHRADSTYASESLRTLVRDAAVRNRLVPAGLDGYTATEEIEAALIHKDGMSVERVLRIDQFAAQASWTREGRYMEHIVGHRALASGAVWHREFRLPSYSIPTLYGNRLDLLLGPYAGSSSDPSNRTRGTVAEMHPLAEGRDSIYRFGGGETVVRLRVDGREIPIVRVTVDPVNVPSQPTSVLRGEIFIDSVRHEIVGMRGQILEIGGKRQRFRSLTAFAFRYVGYLEVMSTEMNGRYWIPRDQRLELRVGSSLVGGETLLLRLTSRMGDIAIRGLENPTAEATSRALIAYPRRATVAARDSLGRFDGWRREMGRATTADEFERVAGPPTVDSFTASGSHGGTIAMSQSLHFNRIEGVYTGTGISVGRSPESQTGGMTIAGGYAWSERRWRGQAVVEQNNRPLALGGRVSRRLDITNDFTTLDDHGSSFIALLGHDDYDYIEREDVALFTTGRWRSRGLRVAAEIGAVRDRRMGNALAWGLWRGDSSFRVNRPVSEGQYVRTTLTLELQPSVLAEYARPGAALLMTLEKGSGALSYARATARVTLRRQMGRMTLGARVDAGIVRAQRYPPQQMFEIGGPTELPGFDYKQFAGNRAALGHVNVAYALPFVAPRLGPFAPQPSAGFSAGYTAVSSAPAAAAVQALGARGSACAAGSTCSSSGLHASAAVGVRLFDGGFFVGVGRRLSDRDHWKPALSVGRLF